MCLGQEATHADHTHTYATSMHTLANTLLWIHAILYDRVEREREREKEDKTETEIDKRDEEITRADTKREKENKSFTKGGGSRSGV